MAFYLESLSNRLYDAFPAKHEKKQEKGSEPIQKFRAVYRKLCQDNLPLSIEGIEDIFKIRHKIFAHPQPLSVVAGTGIPRRQGRDDRKINYTKFIGFPYNYSFFKTQHAEDVVNEVRNFVNAYCNLLKDKVSDQKILDAIRPKELAEMESNRNE